MGNWDFRLDKCHKNSVTIIIKYDNLIMPTPQRGFRWNDFALCSCVNFKLKGLAIYCQTAINFLLDSRTVVINRINFTGTKTQSIDMKGLLTTVCVCISDLIDGFEIVFWRRSALGLEMVKLFTTMALHWSRFAGWFPPQFLQLTMFIVPLWCFCYGFCWCMMGFLPFAL